MASVAKPIEPGVTCATILEAVMDLGGGSPDEKA